MYKSQSSCWKRCIKEIKRVDFWFVCILHFFVVCLQWRLHFGVRSEQFEKQAVCRCSDYFQSSCTLKIELKFLDNANPLHTLLYNFFADGLFAHFMSFVSDLPAAQSDRLIKFLLVHGLLYLLSLMAKQKSCFTEKQMISACSWSSFWARLLVTTDIWWVKFSETGSTWG